MNYYTPQEFDKFKPRSFGKLQPDEANTLVTWLDLMETTISDIHMAALMLYYVMGMDVDVVAEITRLQHVRGIVELFRFRCKQYLEREKNISNEDMKQVFGRVAASSEIILVRKGRGICLFTGKVYPEATVINAVEDSRYYRDAR